MFAPLPPFLDDGVFAWDRLGYSFQGAAPAYLLTDAALHDANSWIVLAALVERAKAGGFESLPLLLPRMNASEEPLLWRACAELLGDAGTSDTLKRMLSFFERDLANAGAPTIQRYVCFALHQSTFLWTVPILLEIFLKSSDREELVAVPFSLSRLLEPEHGPIAYEAGSRAEYSDLVKRRYEELSSRLGTDRVPILYGQAFSVKSVALHLLAGVSSEEPDSVSIKHDRHSFEASTGLDCRSFYREGELQPLAASAVLEGFLESQAADRYDEGVRYFFGHRIPD